MRILRPSSITATVVLGGREHVVARAYLGQWLILEQIRRSKLSADGVREYLALCGVPKQGSGRELLWTYHILCSLNQPTLVLPVSLYSDDPKEQKKTPWEYDLRWVFTWVHIIARAYHWSREEILALDLDEASGYMQEIAISRQLDAEWEYGLSPNAYVYDSASKSERFRPLRRPGWMLVALPTTKPREPSKPIPTNMMPQGLVLDATSILKKPFRSS